MMEEKLILHFMMLVYMLINYIDIINNVYKYYNKMYKCFFQTRAVFIKCLNL
jgi:hypothetical protein